MTYNNIDIKSTTCKNNNNIDVELIAGRTNNNINAEVDIDRLDEVINNMNAKLNASGLSGADMILEKEAKIYESNLILLLLTSLRSYISKKCS